MFPENKSFPNGEGCDILGLNIPRLLLFYRRSLRQRQQCCLEKRDPVCKQHGDLWRYDTVKYFLWCVSGSRKKRFRKQYFGRVSKAIYTASLYRTKRLYPYQRMMLLRDVRKILPEHARSSTVLRMLLQAVLSTYIYIHTCLLRNRRCCLYVIQIAMRYLEGRQS